MSIIEFGAGVHIKTAAEQLVSAAASGEARGSFNGIELVAGPQTTAEAIVAAYERGMEERSVARLNSPEGKRIARERDAEVDRLQETHDALMRDLATLDFSNDAAVLDWLCAMQPAMDHTGVARRKADVLAAFKAKGFEANVNCGDAFNGGDRENVFRWLVGQALSTLEAASIHGIVHRFAAEWKGKFLGTPQSGDRANRPADAGSPA